MGKAEKNGLLPGMPHEERKPRQGSYTLSLRLPQSWHDELREIKAWMEENLHREVSLAEALRGCIGHTSQSMHADKAKKPAATGKPKTKKGKKASPRKRTAKGQSA